MTEMVHRPSMPTLVRSVKEPKEHLSSQDRVRGPEYRILQEESRIQILPTFFDQLRP